MVEGLRLHPKQLQEGKPRSFGTSTGPRGSPAPLAPHGFAWIRSREVTRGLNRGGLGSDQCTGGSLRAAAPLQTQLAYLQT